MTDRHLRTVAGGPVLVLVISPRPLARFGLRHLLTTHPQLRVIAECSSDLEGRNLAPRAKPDLVVLDKTSNPDDPVSASDMRVLAGRAGRQVVALVSSEATPDDLVTMHEEGVLTIAERMREPEELLDVIVRAAGLGVVHDHVVPVGRRPHFTAREHEILELIYRGTTNDAIAEQLVVARSTVKFHIHKIKVKLGARNRTEVAYLAVQAGLLGHGRHDQARPGEVATSGRGRR